MCVRPEPTGDKDEDDAAEELAKEAKKKAKLEKRKKKHEEKMRKKKIWMEKVKELDSATSISWLEHRTTYSCEGPAKHGLIGEDSFTKSVCQHCVLEKEKDPNFVIVKPTTKLE
jgi:hypothetical protein